MVYSLLNLNPTPPIIITFVAFITTCSAGFTSSRSFNPFIACPYFDNSFIIIINIAFITAVTSIDSIVKQVIMKNFKNPSITSYNYSAIIGSHSSMVSPSYLDSLFTVVQVTSRS